MNSELIYMKNLSLNHFIVQNRRVCVAHSVNRQKLTQTGEDGFSFPLYLLFSESPVFEHQTEQNCKYRNPVLSWNH
jgi:hypothetical protein